jgi:putative tricarboxylic transport membrane protein
MEEKMKNKTMVVSCALFIFSVFSAAAAGGTQAAATGDWAPERNVTWYVSSSPGGGSDIFTRTITDLIAKEGFSRATILVNNKTDGGGEVARAQVANTQGALADHTLITFNSGDLMPMVDNTANRIGKFKPIAIMAVDKQLLFIGPKSKYHSFKEVIAAIESGTPVVMGGSKGDDIATFNELLKEMKWSEAQMPYITYDSSNDALTSLLGGHIDIAISKPAATAEYVEAGQMTPILALSAERYGGNLAGAPTLSELGYRNVEIPVWRGVAGPAAMSPAAQAYWSDLLEKVSETNGWKIKYLDKFRLLGEYKDFKEATAFMTKYQEDYLAAKGKK